MTDESLDALHAVLGKATGRARIGPLIELGKVHGDRCQRTMQAGRAADHDLDAAIEALSEAHTLMVDEDPWRPPVATGLARMLMMRNLTRSRDADRDRAIDLFEESLRSPELSPVDVETGHYCAGQLLVLRGLPGAPNGLDLTAVAGMLSGFGAAQRADLDRGIRHFEAVTAAEPVTPQVHQAVAALLPMLRTMATFLGMAGPAGSGGLPDMFQALRAFTQLAPPGTPGAMNLALMRDQLLTQQLRSAAPLPGPLNAIIDGVIHQGSGVDLLLPPFMREFGLLTGNQQIVALGDRVATEQLDASMVRLLTDVTADALAYRSGRDAETLVECARRLSRRSEHGADGAARGMQLLASAMAWLLAGDSGEATAALDAGLGALPPDHPAAVPGVELLVLALHDRRPLGYPLDDTELVGRLDARVGAVAAAAPDGALTPVARAVHAVLRLVADLDDAAALADLARCAGALPSTYPWSCRIRSLLGAVTGGQSGVDILLDNPTRLPADHAARPALQSIAGYAALYATEHLGAPARHAVVRLTQAAEADPGGYVAGALAIAHLRLAECSGEPDDLVRAVSLLEQAPVADVPVVEACRVGAALAEAYRLRGDLARRDHGESVGRALEVLRAWLDAASVGVPVSAGACQFASHVAAWCEADNWWAGVVEALELGAALGSATVPTQRVPYGLEADTRSLHQCRQARTARNLPGSVAVPGVREIASALRSADAGPLVYVHSGLGRLCLVARDETVEVVPAPALASEPPEPVTRFLRGGTDPAARRDLLAEVCEWAGRAAMEPLDRYLAAAGSRGGRLVLVPTGEFERIPWHAARLADRYPMVEYAVTYASSAAEFVATAHRALPPVYGRPALLGGSADGAGEVQALLETIYPNGVCVDPAAPDALRGMLAPVASGGATVLHVTGDMPAIPAAPPGSPTGNGCAVVTGESAAATTRCLLAAGLASVVSRSPGWGRPALAIVFMLHHHLADLGLPPAEALRRTQQWLLDPDRTAPEHMPPGALDGLPEDPADPACWAGLRHHGR